MVVVGPEDFKEQVMALELMQQIMVVVEAVVVAPVLMVEPEVMVL
tara:strand:- start:83 stop:217 length:135 start_codon:yes stop_codon:yes gene_type:complete